MSTRDAVGPRDDARLDASREWQDDYQRRCDEAAAQEELQRLAEQEFGEAGA